MQEFFLVPLAIGVVMMTAPQHFNIGEPWLGILFWSGCETIFFSIFWRLCRSATRKWGKTIVGTYLLIVGCFLAVCALLAIVSGITLRMAANELGSTPSPSGNNGVPRASTADYFYFKADLANDKDAPTEFPLLIVNEKPKPFYRIVAWFSPASVKGNANNPAYWSRPDLKVVWPLLTIGAFRTGTPAPMGYWRIEYNAIYKSADGEELSCGFVELLELQKFNGTTVQLIDVWRRDSATSEIKVYATERPSELRDARAP